MSGMLPSEAIRRARHLFTWTGEEELSLLARLAGEVPPGGRIVEVGALYGASAAVLALVRPDCEVVCVDDFRLAALPDQLPTAERLRANLAALGLRNVGVIEADSQAVGQAWTGPIDLLWLDGDHSREGVLADLRSFGHWAQIIACHDYGNPDYPGVRQAIAEYLTGHRNWGVAEVVRFTAVLRGVPGDG